MQRLDTRILIKKNEVLPIQVNFKHGPRHNPIFKVAVKLKNTRFIEGSVALRKMNNPLLNNFLECIKMSWQDKGYLININKYNEIPL